jgi:hypothetical protein
MADEIIQNIEEELSPEERQKQRLSDLKLQKSLDKSWGIKQDKLLPALAEMNIRLVQYRGQFNTFSEEFLMLQTVQDFIRLIVPLQRKKLNMDKPIAMDKESQKVIIFKDKEFQYKEQ